MWPAGEFCRFAKDSFCSWYRYNREPAINAEQMAAEVTRMKRMLKPGMGMQMPYTTSSVILP